MIHPWLAPFALMDIGSDDGSLYHAAIIIASLDQETAAEICRHLDRELVRRIANQIAALGQVSQGLRDRLVHSFIQAAEGGSDIGGRRYAEELLTRVLGTADLDENFDSPEMSALMAVQVVADREPHVLWRALETETRQLTAAVLAQLRPADTARVLALMPSQTRADVTYRAARLGTIAPGAIEAVMRSLAQTMRTSGPQQGRQQENGLQFVLDLIQSVDRATERELVEGLKALDSAFGASVEERLLTFEDLFSLPDQALQGFLRQVQTRTLALALRGAEERISQRVFSNLSSRMQEELRQEIELTGPVKVSDVEQAQREITNLARALEDRGELNLRQDQEQYI